MPINVYLQEATEKPKGASPKEIAAEIKRQLQTCRLSNFKSADSCLKFYSSFFLPTIEAQDVELTMSEWFEVYNTLFSDKVFFDNLCMYMVSYAPFTYADVFHPLYVICVTEIEQETKRKVTAIATAKSLFNFLGHKFELVSNVVSPQLLSPPKFMVVVMQTLVHFTFQLHHLIQDQLEQEADPNEIQPIEPEPMPMQEDAYELIHILETADEWIARYMEQDELSEGVVKVAQMKAKEAKMKMDKASRAFDEFVMKRYREMTIKRRNAKHSELVGESLRITREIKRLLKSGALAILSPTAGVLHWIVTLFIDKKTDMKDRKVLVNEIEDELEIIEEKISMAERNGDDKAKIELIRFRQKLRREYERIRKVRYDELNRKAN